MDASIIAKNYCNAADTGKIKADVLKHIPTLVTCENWDKIIIMGSIDHTPAHSPAHYKGALVKYCGGLYFVSQALLNELSKIEKRFKKIKTTIKVVE